MSTDWFVAAFRERYLEVYPHRDLPSARREIAGVMAMRGAAGTWGPTLDLGCGFGRHSLALREAGVNVVGMDLSIDLLRLRTTLPGADRIAGRLACGDMRTLPFARESLRTVTCLFSSFGYFADGANVEVLRGVREVLQPGGRLLLDLMNGARIRRTLVPRSERAVGDGTLIEVRSLSDDQTRVRKQVCLRAPDGREERWHEDVRMYAPDEIDVLAVQAGLRFVSRAGDFDGSPFGPDSPRQLVWFEAVSTESGQKPTPNLVE